VVVEDNEDSRKMLKVMLELTGNSVFEAADSASALRLAELHRPEVMIVDIGLPDMDGYELASRIRGTEWGRTVLLIALTGYGQSEDKRRALASGFDAHATKPVLPDQLAQLIEPANEASEGRAA
jgi:CheY-like chemotaxis protein